VPDIIDNTYVIIEFENGARGMLDLFMFAKGSKNEQKIYVIGKTGKVEAFVPENIVCYGLRIEGRDSICPPSHSAIVARSQPIRTTPGFSYPLAQITFSAQQIYYPAQLRASAHSLRYFMSPPPGFHPQPAYHLLPAKQTGQITQHNGTVAASPAGPIGIPRRETTLPHAFTTGTLHDPASGTWNFDTSASSHLNNSVTNLSEVFNLCMYPSVLVGDGHAIPVTNTGHSILPTFVRSLHLNNVFITPYIIKNLISVRQFICDNNCTIEFDAFGFSVKDFMTRRVLLRCDSTGDLYLVTHPSPIPHAFLVSQHMWHQRLGHPGDGTLSRYKARLVANGSTELERVDVDETFSLVVKP
nr:ribonuclease H-like domain-containing protein [Tanacetum cinerariifolium]